MMKNWRLKFGSLVAAILLAIFVNYFFTPTEFGSSVVQLIAPVEIRNVPDNKSVIWPATRQVELTVQGSSLFLSKVALNPPVVRVALPENSAKSFNAKLTAANVNLPATVRLLGIKPSELEFGLDDIIEKNVPVVVPQIGILAPELKLEKVRIDPPEIALRGPSQELKSVSSIESNPVNLDSIDRSTDMELELRTPWNLVASSARTVKVSIEVSDAIGEVTFQNVPVILDVQNEKIRALNPRLAQKAVSVSLRASKKVLRHIKKEDLLVRAQLLSDSQINESLELSLDSLTAVDSVMISPRKVSVVIDAVVVPTITSKKSATSSLPASAKTPIANRKKLLQR